MISSPSAIFFQARNRHRAAAAVVADVAAAVATVAAVAAAAAAVAADAVAAADVAAGGGAAAAAAVEVQQIFNHFKSKCTFNKLLFDVRKLQANCLIVNCTIGYL